MIKVLTISMCSKGVFLKIEVELVLMAVNIIGLIHPLHKLQKGYISHTIFQPVLFFLLMSFDN